MSICCTTAGKVPKGVLASNHTTAHPRRAVVAGQVLNSDLAGRYSRCTVMVYLLIL